MVAETVYLLQSQEKVEFGPSLELCMTPEIYDAQNTIVGFLEPSITSANKNDFVTHDKYKEIKKGSNAIVMGDMLDDIKIVQDLELGTRIAVGFFNSPERGSEAQLKKYTETFDIVLANDGNMSHVAELVRHIAGLPADPVYPTYGPSAAAFIEFLHLSK